MAKKNRKSRQNGSIITERHKASRQRKQELFGHAPSRNRYGTDWHEPKARTDVKLRTFEDEYKEFRRSRGHRGLSPTPEKRPLENPYVGSAHEDHPQLGYRNDTVKGTNRFFPIGECLERPITASKIKHVIGR